MTAPFTAGKHPRGAGGLFAATAATKTAHPAGAWAAGPVRKGAGRKGAADPRVKAAQQKLNALGVGDERGRPLLVDGVDGSHTTAAIKRWQASKGQPQTGELDAKAMVALLTDTPTPKVQAQAQAQGRPQAAGKPTARSRMRGTRHKSRRAAKKPAAPAQPYADHGRGFSRMGPGAST